jgi:endonuclease-3
MRTSRISRDTARILAATRTQRALRQTRSATRPAEPLSDGVSHDDNGDSDSALSSVPSDSGSDGEARPAKRRKREPGVVKKESKEVAIDTIASPEKAKKARRTPAKKVTANNGSVKIEPPAQWEEIYALTREMRNENLAPVDTMGCESLAERSRTPREQRFQTLIALMLSSQTKDTVTAVAMKGMQDKMPGVSTSSRSTRPSLKSTGLQPRISPGSRVHRTQRLHQ